MSEDIKLPALAAEILGMAQEDQRYRIEATPEEKETQAWRDELKAMDRKHTSRMKEIMVDIGYPTFSQVGREASHAAWILIQHADHDPVFQKSCLALMESEGPAEAGGQEIAYLTDRIRKNEGKPQLYGSQHIKDPEGSGKWVPYPIEDPENVDARRARMGLPTQAENTAELNENHAYGTKASSLKKAEPDQKK